MAAAKGPKKAYRFPAGLGRCIARLAVLRDAIDKAKAVLAPLEDEETALYDHFIRSFKKGELEGARGAGLVLSVSTTTVPNLKDWKQFFAFATKKGNDDLLMRRVNTAAWRQRNDAKVKVPGTEPFNRVGLSVTKQRAERKPRAKL